MVPFVFVLLVSIINSQSVCNYSAIKLPWALQKHQTAYFPDSRTVYLFGGTTHSWYIGGFNSGYIYKWNLSEHHDWIKLNAKVPIDTDLDSFSGLSFISSINIVVIDNLAYFIGVYENNYDDDWIGHIYIFNASTETFENTTNLQPVPSPSTYGCLTTNNSHIFMVGGRGVGHPSVPYLQVYDIADNRWYVHNFNNYTQSNLKQRLSGLKQYCAMIDNSLYVIGGYNWDQLQPIPDIWRYDLLADKWTFIQYKPDATAEGFTIHWGDNIYIIGGVTKTEPDEEYPGWLDNIDVFNTKNNTLKQLTKYFMNEPLSGISAQIIDDKLYIFGGLYHDEGSGGDDETLTKTWIQICDIGLTQKIDEELPPQIIALSDVYRIVIVIILCVIMLVGLIGFIDAKCCRPNDFFQPMAFIKIAFHLYDMLSDIFFSAQLYLDMFDAQQMEMIFLIMFILSIVLIVIPIIMTIFQLYRVINKDWIKDNNLRLWLLRWSSELFFFSIIMGSSFAAIELCNSCLLSLNIFCMGLNKKYLYQYRTKRIYSIIMIENIPQFLIQIFYIFVLNPRQQVGIIPVATLISTLISIIVMIVTIIISKRVLVIQRHCMIKLDISEPSITKQHRGNMKEIRKQISIILEVALDAIEVQIVDKDQECIQLLIYIYVNVDENDNSFERVIISANKNGKLGKIIQQCWKLNNVPKICNIIYVSCKADESEELHSDESDEPEQIPLTSDNN